MSAINNIVSSSIHPAVAGQDASSFSQASVAQGVASQPMPPKLQTSGSAGASSGRKPTKEEVNQVLEDLIKRQQGSPTSVQFSVDEKLDQVVIKVVDPTTQKVIKQIPSEAIMKMREDMLAFESKSSTGLLLSEKT